MNDSSSVLTYLNSKKFVDNWELSNYSWGTYRNDRTSRLSHLITFPSHLNVIIGENLLLSFFSYTFKPEILQSYITSHLTSWFCHDSQKASMPSIHIHLNFGYWCSQLPPHKLRAVL